MPRSVKHDGRQRDRAAAEGDHLQRRARARPAAAAASIARASSPGTTTEASPSTSPAIHRGPRRTTGAASRHQHEIESNATRSRHDARTAGKRESEAGAPQQRPREPEIDRHAQQQPALRIEVHHPCRVRREHDSARGLAERFQIEARAKHRRTWREVGPPPHPALPEDIDGEIKGCAPRTIRFGSIDDHGLAMVSIRYPAARCIACRSIGPGDQAGSEPTLVSQRPCDAGRAASTRLPFAMASCHLR